MPGSLFLVATPIGNLEDITLRALRVLREVDLIAAEDTRRTGHLLTHFGITTPTISLHAHNERRRVPELVEKVAAGATIAVVTDAGMPAISDPGHLIVREALEAGLPVTVIPGVSALTMAVAGAGIPTDEFCFLGFAPPRAGERRRWVESSIKPARRTTVFFESPMRLHQTLGDLRELAGDRHIVIARELTKLHESWHRGWVSDVLAGEKDPVPARGEAVVLVSALERPSSTISEGPKDEEIVAMYEQLSTSSGVSRRTAIRQVASSLQVTPKLVYTAIERAKNSVK